MRYPFVLQIMLLLSLSLGKYPALHYFSQRNTHCVNLRLKIKTSKKQQFLTHLNSEAPLLPSVRHVMPTVVRTTRPETCEIFAQRYQSGIITTKFQRNC